MILMVFLTINVCASTKASFEINGIPQGEAYKNTTAALKNLSKKIQDSKHKVSVESIQQNTKEFITSSLEPFGYLSPTISTTIVEQSNDYKITADVSPGRAVTVTKVEITIEGEAKNDPEFIKLINSTKLKKNTQLNIKEYNKLKYDLYNLSSARGYFESTIKTSNVIINKQKLTAKILINFQSGARYKIHKVTINNTSYNLDFLKKYISIKEGENYSSKNISNSKKNLISSNLFSNANLQTKNKNNKNNTIDIAVVLTDKKPREYLIGAGYGTDTGARGTLGMQFNHVGNNGGQISFLSQGSLGTLGPTQNINNSAAINYSRPGSNPLTTKYNISTGIGHTEQSTGTSNAKKIAFSQIYSKSKWRRTLSLNILNEHYDITTLPNTNTAMIYPSLNWYYRNADDTLNPSKGLSVSLNIAGTNRALSTQDAGFFQIRADSIFLATINKIKTRILFKNSIGNTTITNLDTLPLSLQLFTGGSMSLRGFSYNSIGPGRNLLTNSIELQRSIFGSTHWFIAGFFDIGTVSNQNVFNYKSLYKDAGPGIVWLSPLGMMEISAGFPIDAGEDQSKFKIQFSMGPAL